MAFGDTVRTATSTGTSGAAEATLSVGATSGNLLVFSVARAATHGIGGAWGTPTGFTDLPNSGVANGNIGGGGWYKIATGGETTVTTNGTNEAGNWSASLVEYEGPFAGTPLDVSADDETNVATTVTSQSTGTTGTTAQADALAIAMVTIDNGSNFGTKQYTNSFTEVVTVVSGARAGHVQAKRVLSATGTIETTLSYSSGGTADEMYGAVAVWKKDAGGGGRTVLNTRSNPLGVAVGMGWRMPA